MKGSIITLTVLLINTLYACGNEPDKPTVAFNVSIPTAGNSWVMSNSRFISSDLVTPAGIRDWNDLNHTIRTFFYVEKTGKISLGIASRVDAGASQIEVAFAAGSKKITLSGAKFTDTFIGDFQVKKPGYYFVDIKGVKKEGNIYADVSAILLKTEDPESIKYIKAENAITDDFHFERRGPSDHLFFEIPGGVDNVEWFYSELLIPENQDVEGSYFMANGFSEGYFGIQVNSPVERRILFSIWSPYETDNPSEIPEDYKIKLLKKGEDVKTGEFGNEGSGGQSFKIFNWKTNTHYGFLVGARPAPNESTDYTAYFFDPEMNNWNLIAQFRRPKTKTYLTGLYSFLENFIPDQGVFDRKGLYQNQWVYNASGWHEISSASFSADVTAEKGYRLDYSGGIENDGFYLKNCGFTNDHTPVGVQFQRKKLNREPKIDFEKLD